MITVEVKHIEQIANGRHVAWNVVIITVHFRVGQVIAAAIAEFCIQHPVPFHEFHKRGMLVIGVTDMAAVEKGETAMMGMRGPVPKKSTHWMKPES